MNFELFSTSQMQLQKSGGENKLKYYVAVYFQMKLSGFRVENSLSYIFIQFENTVNLGFRKALQLSLRDNSILCVGMNSSPTYF